MAKINPELRAASGLLLVVCGKQDHIAHVCRSYKQAPPSTKYKRFADNPPAIIENCFAISRGRRVTEVTTHQRNPEVNKLILTVKIKGVACQMEVDTGSAKSIVSWSTIKKLMPTLRKSQLCLALSSFAIIRGITSPSLGMAVS